MIASLQFIFINSLHAFLSSADFFKINFFEKILSGMPSECQTVWIQIRPNNLLGLTWFHTVCKGYKQTTKLAASKERVKSSSLTNRIIVGSDLLLNGSLSVAVSLVLFGTN